MGFIAERRAKNIAEQKQANEEKQASMKKLFSLEEELEETRDKYGVKERYGKFGRAVAHYFDHQDNRVKLALSKKLYVFLSILTGWMGGHRFYAKQYRTAIIYLLFCWTGFPLAMAFIDLIVVIPMKADTTGRILV